MTKRLFLLYLSLPLVIPIVLLVLFIKYCKFIYKEADFMIVKFVRICKKLGL